MAGSIFPKVKLGWVERATATVVGFVKAGFTAKHAKLAIPAGTTATIITISDPDLKSSYRCPLDLLDEHGELLLTSSPPEDLNVFVLRGGSAIYSEYSKSGPNLPHLYTMHPHGDHVTIQVQGKNVATIELFTVQRPPRNDCHVQAQAFITR
jgi:hypothetical protein